MIRWSATPLKKLFVIFFIWRIALFTIGFLAPQILPYRENSEFTRIAYFSHDIWAQNQLIEPWSNFDGVHYFLIAKQGYDNEARFFPTYPLSIRFLTFITGIPKQWMHIDFLYVFCGLLISHAAFLGAIFLLHKLLRFDFSEKIAFWSCLFLIFFPTSFFFVSVYSESLLLLLSVGALWCARKKWWFWAAVCAAFASATRLVGIFLLPALLVEYCVSVGVQFSLKNRGKQFFSSLRKIQPNILLLFLAPVGLIAFILFNQIKFGKWDMFVEQQAALGNSRSVTSFVDPVRTVVRYVRILTTVFPQQYEWSTALLEFGMFVLGIILFLFLCRYVWQKKIRFSYWVFATGCFFLPIISGTLTGLPRYILVAFPLFIVLGMIENEKFCYTLLAIFLLLGVILTILFSRGYFIA